MNADRSIINGSYVAKIEGLNWPGLNKKNLKLDVLRLDKIHPVISGNKFFKLKYYLERARVGRYKRILTWGGAYSNHLIAAACAAKLFGFESIGIVRGEKSINLSHTLHDAQEFGMQLIFVNRQEYGQRAEKGYMNKLARKFPDTLIVPEGGAGPEGVQGAKEIMHIADTSSYSRILCAVGTGTMMLGLARAALPHQQILGFSVLKGSEKEPGTISAQLAKLEKRSLVAINRNYHFGGYAKKNQELFEFMNSFYEMTRIPLDFVYTAKLFYGALDLVNQKYFPEQSSILLVHSGGLQGNLSLRKGELVY
jgi:1-aminocyclopropane-1-carboxylate deaminase/D-cysteine desulfhydrase-like pyridoxal-dependent ACC family enzyme